MGTGAEHVPQLWFLSLLPPCWLCFSEDPPLSWVVRNGTPTPLSPQCESSKRTWVSSPTLLARAWRDAWQSLAPLPSSELSPGPLKVGVILMSQLRKTGQERGGKRPSQNPALRKWQAWELALRSPIMRLTRCLLCSEGRQGLGSLTLKPCPKAEYKTSCLPRSTLRLKGGKFTWLWKA